MADDSSDSSQLDPTGADSKASLFERILGVTNSLAQVGGIAVAAGAAFVALEKLINTKSAPSNFIVPDLANNGSTGFGFRAAAGGAGTSATIIREVNSITPNDAVLDAGFQGGTWEALDFMINKTLNEDWTTQNGSPGNPNIIAAYRSAGRAFTRDGGSGQYSWAAAYVTYILSNSGMTSLQTMSPMAYCPYGNTVDFRRGPLFKVRKWDVVVFTSDVNIQHVGFIKSYNPTTKMFEIVGGDQAETVKVTQMPYSPTDPKFRTIHVRRNWTIPASEDYPLWQRPAPLSGVRLSPVAATYLDSAGNDTGIPVVTDNLSTDTLIYNAGQAINSAEAVEAASPAPRPTSNAVVANNGTGAFYDGIRQVSLFESSRGPHDPQKKLELKKRVIAEYNHLSSPRRIGPR
jgi:hypothetical protein